MEDTDLSESSFFPEGVAVEAPGSKREGAPSGWFELVAAAKSRGGDRYRGDLSCPKSSTTCSLDIYFPQMVSRLQYGSSSQLPARRLYVTVEDSHYSSTSTGIRLLLAKAAKKLGGDKYEGIIEGEEVTIYLPQEITRSNGREARKSFVLLVTDTKRNREGASRKNSMNSDSKESGYDVCVHDAVRNIKAEAITRPTSHSLSAQVAASGDGDENGQTNRTIKVQSSRLKKRRRLVIEESDEEIEWCEEVDSSSNSNSNNIPSQEDGGESHREEDGKQLLNFIV